MSEDYIHSLPERFLPALHYGRIRSDSPIFRLLGFKKTDADDVDELKKTIPQAQLDAFFESELRQRYGISSADLNVRYGDVSQGGGAITEEKLPFPALNVRSWDALRKHAVEMLVYADPVRYEQRVRSIRTSNRPREAKAYLQNMYRYEGDYRFKFACQLCHETCSSFEVTEMFPEPETELDPVNLCLCPNCAARYRAFRRDSNIMYQVRVAFLLKSDSEIDTSEYVVVPIDDNNELWFTQTHFAEIRELLRLTEEVNSLKKAQPIQTSEGADDEKTDMSVYAGYIGKIMRRKDGFAAKVSDVVEAKDGTYLIAHIIEGKNAGKDTKIQLSFILENRNVYTISDE